MAEPTREPEAQVDREPRQRQLEHDEWPALTEPEPSDPDAGHETTERRRGASIDTAPDQHEPEGRREHRVPRQMQMPAHRDARPDQERREEHDQQQLAQRDRRARLHH
ncbi:MAG: hypothetical protein R3E53_11675 [Myxococcota bacterium]